jgi:hypothetical protein
MTIDDNSLLIYDNYYNLYPSIVVSLLINKMEKKMKQTSQKIAIVLTVLVMVASTSNSFSQVKELMEPAKYSNYVGNLQNGINSENLGLKINAIQYTGIYQIAENEALLIQKYKEEKNPNIKTLIAISLFMIGNSEALQKIGLDEKSVLNNISLSMLADMYKAKSEIKIRTFATLDK